MAPFSEKYTIAIECQIMPKSMSTQGFHFETACVAGLPSICLMEQNKISYKNGKEINKIQSFSSLDKNWDSYDATKISEEVINNSVHLIEKLDQFDQDIYFTAPGPNGEISVELKRGNKNAEILIYPKKKYKYVFFEGSNFKDQGTLHFNKIPEIIQWLFSESKTESGR